MNQEGRIAEYNALRNEVLAITNRRVQRLSVTWTALAALITASSISKTPEIASLSLLFVASAWADELSLLLQTSRIGRYIEFFIEPYVDGLSWERMTTHRSPAPRSMSKRIKLTMFSNYGVASIVAIIASIALAFKYLPTEIERQVIFIFVSILGISLLYRSIKKGCFIEEHKSKSTPFFKKLASEYNAPSDQTTAIQSRDL